MPELRKVPRLPMPIDAPRGPDVQLSSPPLRFIRIPGASLIDFLNQSAIITLGSSSLEILSDYGEMIESGSAIDSGQSQVENDSAPLREAAIDILYSQSKKCVETHAGAIK